MRNTPYHDLPSKAYWSRAVSRGWNARDMVGHLFPLMTRTDRVMSAGSCFAANMIPYIETAGFRYVRTEPVCQAFNVPKEAYNYHTYSAAYGNIYTPRQLLQLLSRAMGIFDPHEKYWHADTAYIDPFRPGLRYQSRSAREFELLTRQHLQCFLAALRQANVFIFTLGLTEAWMSRADGAVYPACPGTIAGIFEESKYVFHNFSVTEICSDLDAFVTGARRLNPDLRVILTVSPVPLVATATGSHVVEATTFSKSVLRVAASQISSAHDRVCYFPAFELVTGRQAATDLFDRDRRTITKPGLDLVMDTFLSACDMTPGPTGSARRSRDDKARRSGDLGSDNSVSVFTLSQRLVTVECEEEILNSIVADTVDAATIVGGDRPPRSRTDEGSVHGFVVSLESGNDSDTLTNIEHTATASQSSYSIWSREGESMNVINGQHAGDYGFHTDFEDEPWWGADFGTMVPIDCIIIHNRVSGFQERARTLTVQLAVTPDEWITIHSGTTEFGAAGAGRPLRLVAKTPVRARFVKLSLAERQALHLSKVEILTRSAPR